MKNDLKLVDILRAQSIKRWTIVNTAKQQSLAEHTFNVMAIARRICTALNIDDRNVMKYAFDHDLDEVLTGDIPTPAKKRLEIDLPYNGNGKELCSELELAVVKTADVMEALIFIRENGIGKHAQLCDAYLNDKIEEILSVYNAKWPGYRGMAKMVFTEATTVGDIV